MGKKALYLYKGEEVDVQWDGRLCIHVGECGRSEGQLFVAGRDPWCTPGAAESEDVQEVIQRCPTGALSVHRHDGATAELPAPRNTIAVANNGPLYVQGDLTIEGAKADMPAVRFRAALCRCGKSENKPFCDNTHEHVAFIDHGAVGARGHTLESEGGPLTIKAAPHGPLLVSGNFSILTPSGRVAWQGKKAALCRCGGSKNKPFCDGTHSNIGFEAT